jgi:uncharacterized protein (TIGR02996 family)
MTASSSSEFAEHDAFLLAIHETPGEDPPRLIYADWLEECGDAVWRAYAEFIRVQIELARIKSKSKRRKAALQLREQELQTAHGRTWLGPWGQAHHVWRFHRGIPAWLIARARQNWIGRRLGRDMGFEDWVEFDDHGQLAVSFGDPNWGYRLIGFVHGRYQLQFTYAEVCVQVELFRVEGRTLRYAGRLSHGGACVELASRNVHPPDPHHVILRLLSSAECGMRSAE